MDDPELREIVLSYIESLPQQLDDIEKAHANKNFTHLSKILHKLIGSGGMVGLDPLTQSATALDKCVIAQEFEQMAQEIAQLRQITAQVQRGARELPPIETTLS